MAGSSTRSAAGEASGQVRITAGTPDGDGVRRDVLDDDGVSADLCTVPDPHRPEDLGARTHHDVVAEGRVTLAATHRLAAERGAVEPCQVRRCSPTPAAYILPTSTREALSPPRGERASDLH